MSVKSPTSWKEKYRLLSHEVDLNGYAHPHYIVCYMLDSASAHVIGSQFSYDALHSAGQLWVLSRFLVVFHKLPKWNEEITVETWGKGIDRLFGLRDFIISSGTDEKLISATSAWLLIDRKSNRPQRLEKLKETFPFQTDRYELDIKLEKIPPISGGKKEVQYIVHYTDIDVNKHVNSSKYVQWILDSFSPAMLQQKTLSTFEINFLAEAQLSDHLSVYTENSDEFFISEIKRENDDTVLCRAKLLWQNKE